MYWTDAVVKTAEEKYKDKIKKGEPLVIRDEKTASGRVHVGSLRGVAIHGAIAQVLNERGIKNKYLFEINDFDPMDGLPVYLDAEKYKEHMGKPLLDVPSPDGKAKNFAEYFAGEFIDVIKEVGYTPEYYRSSDVYKSGRYDEAIKTILDNAATIRGIYKKVSGADRPDSWLPLAVLCENCGKIGTTKATDWNGETVAYECGDFVVWAKGCGQKGRVAPFGGRAKLPWKVEWPVKFIVHGVDIEGGGKDHSTKGGPRDIAEAIIRQVFKREPPINIPYEWIYVGGKKMSSSKGMGSSSKEISDLLPPHILRFLLLHKEPHRIIDFVPDGDTVPIMYDTYDKFALNYFKDNTDDFARAFFVSHIPSEQKHLEPKTLPRFSQIAFLVQMPHLDTVVEVEKIEGKNLTTAEKTELKERSEYAKRWLTMYAPEDYRYEIKKELPLEAKTFSLIQKQALAHLAKYIEEKVSLTGQDLHTRLHEMKSELSIEPKALFEAIYVSILGKTNGPKAGWFLSVLDKDFLIKRLKEASI